MSLAATCLFMLVCLSMNFGCGTAATTGVNQNSTVAAVEPTSLERDIESMKTADFEFIYVFRRKDGGPFESADKTFLKANSPADTNRFVLSDMEKAVVAGSSYKFEPAHLVKLGEKFDIENYSVERKEQNMESTDNGNTDGSR